MKRMISIALLLSMLLLAGCANSAQSTAPSTAASEVTTEAVAEAATEAATEETVPQVTLADGVYTAKFDTDSSMFHVSEAKEGLGVLTVENGQMTIHVSLAAQGILQLFPGLAEDAVKEGAALLEHTVDTVTYSDGISEEVFGFDVPVPYLDAEFDLALVGKKGTWYDHKVSVSDPQPLEETVEALADGVYTADVAFEGGSGKVKLESPCELTVKDGVMTAKIHWSSKNYDYMIVDGEKLLPESVEEGAIFLVPVAALNEALPMIADTVAMSTPHEIEYTLTFSNVK